MNSAEKEASSAVQAWLMVLICGLSLIASILFGSTLIALYTATISDDLGIARGALSLYMTVKYLATFVSNLSLVKILKWFKLKWVILFGVILSAIMLVLYSLSSNMVLICISGVLGGIGYALAGNAPASMLVRNWFKTSQGTAVGIVTSFTGIGGIVINPIMSVIINRFGWRFGFRTAAAVCTVIALIVLLFLKSSPEDVNMLPYGVDKVEAKETEVQKCSEKSDKKRDRKNLSMLLVIFFLVTIGSLSAYYALTAILQEIGFDLIFTTGIAASVLSGSILFGKVGLGWANDHVGTRSMTLLWYGVAVLSTIYFVLYRGMNPFLALIGVFLIGTSTSIYIIPAQVLCSKMFPEKKKYTNAISYCTAASSLGMSVSSPIAHGLYDIFGTYVVSLLYAFTVSIICFTLMAIILHKNMDVLRDEGKRSA